ncbi:MAG TPA: YciI family protein [Ornithinibacter sp.]|nr:YciI family protein [Ornithinibacter sp.]
MTEYVVLVTGDADRWWTELDADERAHGYAEHTRFDQELARRGHRVTGGAELHGMTGAKRIPPGGGPVSDGPFVEVTEQVGGFYQVETDDLDDLLECCRIIAALGDGIEVRRVVTPQERSA